MYQKVLLQWSKLVIVVNPIIFAHERIEPFEVNYNIVNTFHFSCLVQKSGRNQLKPNENVIVSQIVQKDIFSHTNAIKLLYCSPSELFFMPQSVFNLFEFFFVQLRHPL